MLSVNRFEPQPQDRLFNSEAFFRLHAPECAFYFQWMLKGRVAMCLHVSEVATAQVRSPRRGTFGAVSFFEDVALPELEAFLLEVTRFLQRQGIRRLELLLPPAAHADERVAEQHFVLRSLGFSETLCDVNYAISVDERPLSQRLNYANRKRLNKCVRDGFSAGPMDASLLAEVYELIQRNRQSKGYPMTMTLPQLYEMQTLFPAQVLLYGCHAGDTLAAAALCLQVSPAVLYVFYWGDDAQFSGYSPVTLLADAIYSDCQHKGVALLDIGTASEEGQANQGLIRFKRGLGCEASLKFRLEKILEP